MEVGEEVDKSQEYMECKISDVTIDITNGVTRNCSCFLSTATA